MDSDITRAIKEALRVKRANIKRMEDRLTMIRTAPDYADAVYHAALEDLLIMIVTHLKGEEIR